VIEVNTDPASCSNLINDSFADILMSGADNATESDMRRALAGLDDDGSAEMLALF
jgi:hypothetical protein